MMITGETVIAPPLPGDVNDALRKAYATAKPAVELRPAIDQTILNAARENARQSMPFYKKIPWYTQFSMAGAVFGSLFLSTVVIYKTVVHKHDKGVEAIVTAEVAVKTEEARKKAPMVVSILAENGGGNAVVFAPAIEVVQPTIMASADTAPAAKVVAEPAVAANAEASAKAEVKLAAPSDAEARSQDKIVMADAAILPKESSRNRAATGAIATAESSAPANNVVVASAAKAKEAKKENIVIATLTPPPSPVASPIASPVAARALAPQIAAPAARAAPAAPAIAAAPAVATNESAQAWQTRIDALLRTGKNAQAKTELQALLKRYPDTVLTAELKRLLTE